MISDFENENDTPPPEDIFDGDEKLSAEANSRRQFLTAGGLLAGHKSQEADQADQIEQSYLLHLSRRAMACDFEVYFNAGQYEQAAESGMEALDLVELLEDQMTVYRNHSHVSWLNRNCANEPQVVEQSLSGLLRRCLELTELTGGAFDITSTPLSKAWGFFRREAALPDEEAIADALTLVGSRHLEFDSHNSTLSFGRAGVEINLGSIGKGFALDRSAGLILENGNEEFLIHGGRSSVLAQGSRRDGQTLREGRQGWQIAIRHPMKPEQVLCHFWVRNQAVGTSGDANQFFYHNGVRYGHVIDPRSGEPSQGVLSASVVTPSAADADALATACFVDGPELASEYVKKLENTGFIIVTDGDRQGSTQLHVLNIDDDQLEVIGHVSEVIHHGR